MRRILVTVLLPVLLAACANSGLRELQNPTSGPDEFLIDPVRPLDEPPDYNTLPPPAASGANRADRSALAEGVLAFGGTPQSANAPIPAADGALVNAANRYGTSPGIREQLATEDAAFRKRRGRFTQIRIVPQDRYDRAYRRQRLDSSREEERWRRAGARTPSNPPAPGISFQ